MNQNLIAQSSVVVDAPAEQVWQALTSPPAIRQYMFGATVESQWKAGSPITWKGEWEGNRYEDKGVIVHVEPGRRLEYTHFSPRSGLPDRPENYHTVTVELSPEGRGTRISLLQDHNATEEARLHSERNWGIMLQGLKQYVEGAPARS